jgi:hypothetical protein
VGTSTGPQGSKGNKASWRSATPTKWPENKRGTHVGVELGGRDVRSEHGRNRWHFLILKRILRWWRRRLSSSDLLPPSKVKQYHNPKYRKRHNGSHHTYSQVQSSDGRAQQNNGGSNVPPTIAPTLVLLPSSPSSSSVSVGFGAELDVDEPSEDEGRVFVLLPTTLTVLSAFGVASGFPNQHPVRRTPRCKTSGETHDR